MWLFPQFVGVIHTSKIKILLRIGLGELVGQPTVFDLELWDCYDVNSQEYVGNKHSFGWRLASCKQFFLF